MDRSRWSTKNKVSLTLGPIPFHCLPLPLSPTPEFSVFLPSFRCSSQRRSVRDINGRFKFIFTPYLRNLNEIKCSASLVTLVISLHSFLPLYKLLILGPIPFHCLPLPLSPTLEFCMEKGGASQFQFLL